MPYRLLHVVAPRGLADRASDALEEADVSASRVDGEEASLFVAYAQVEVVEGATELLRDAGLGERGFVSISSTEAVISKRVEEERESGEQAEGESEGVAREELVAEAEGMASLSTNFLLLTVVSAAIATAGIIADSTAVVIGSMVIAPLIGPAMASCIGTVVGEPDLFSRGIFAEAVGLMAAIISSAAFALLVFSFVTVPPVDILSLGEVSERATPGVLSMAVAIGAGIAGALSLTTGLSAALVGVMIAVALIPPASTAGIGIALGDTKVTLGSTVLLLVNVFSINLAGTLTFRYRGYGPSDYFEKLSSEKTLVWRVGFMLSFLLILSTVLGAITYDSYKNNVFEREVRGALTEEGSALGDAEGVTLVSFSVRYEAIWFGLAKDPDQVVIRVWYSDGLPPDLADQVATDIRSDTGEEVSVVVEPREVLVID